jgi:hypothetical protein
MEDDGIFTTTFAVVIVVTFFAVVAVVVWNVFDNDFVAIVTN